VTVVYSPQANPLIERLIAWMRPHERAEFVAKVDAAREMLRAVGRNRSLGVLADLRVDSGPSLPFFGIPAATTVVPARLAQRRGYPLVGAHVVREADSRFRVVFEEPIYVERDGEEAAERATIALLQTLERWIADNPGQWLCTKRRWPRPARVRRTPAAPPTPESAAT
jgi:KDO2-lipid IV(A) lauroyltransferase